METQRMTVQEALEKTVSMMEQIMVPVAYAQQIAKPLDQAVYQLKLCINALNNPEKPDETKDGDDSDV